MPRSSKNILQHELIGLGCEVVAASNKANVGVNGKIVDETQKTLSIRDGAKTSKIQKKNSVFRVALDRNKIDIDGNAISARPEDRIKRKVKIW